MKLRRFLILSTLVLSVIFSQHSAFGEVDSLDGKIKNKGYTNTITYTEKRISEDKLEIITEKGIPVLADLVEKRDSIEGVISINDKSGSRVYTLYSKEKFTENGIERYAGVVNEGGLYFELFVLENGESVINIFDLDSEGRRVDPFTIYLNGKAPKVEKMQIENKIIEFGILEKSEYDLLGGLSKSGLRLQVQGYSGRADDTPWITRLWTDESYAIKESSQRESQITRVNILGAFIETDAPSRSSFQSIQPASSNDTEFTVPFSIKGRKLSIPVRTSSTEVISSGFSNPQSFEYSWMLKKANAYENGRDSEGILTQQLYLFNENTRRNSHGYIVINVNTWLEYEVVGNYREYFKVRGNLDIWYK